MSSSARSDASRAAQAARRILPTGFCVLRTPLLPLSEFLRWGDDLAAPAALGDAARLEQALAADCDRLRARLRAVVERADVREALFVASPDLEESLPVWARDPASERGQRVERAVVRYFARMTSRATPFGLFAGCSLATVGAETRLEVGGRDRLRRHTRLDTDYLCGLADALGRDTSLREELRYRPNSSLYRAAGRLRYAEAKALEKYRTYHLVTLEASEYLVATLERAAGGARAADLAAALAGSVEGVSPEEARQYVNELIDSQILVADLEPAVTGAEPAHGLLVELRGHAQCAEVIARVKRAHQALETIDSEGVGVAPRGYRDVAALLEDLPGRVDPSRLFQVDMIRPSPRAALGETVVEEIARGVEILHRLCPSPDPEPLQRFREAFEARYEGREVPLVEALDDEAGLGFPPRSEAVSDATPLLEALPFPDPPPEPARWEPRHAYLLGRLEEALRGGVMEVCLEPRDIERMEVRDPLPLPDALEVLASVGATSEDALARGEFRVILEGVDGPPGARLLGRFCHADEDLRREVQRHLQAEEALQVGAVFAEIVHLPQGRVGNIIARPVLRGYEIPFLGRSGAPAERQIPITDLRISVADGRVILRSARLQREVLPRLTTAHDHTRVNLWVYRFLCTLQKQGVAGSLRWSWGPLESAPFLPRLTCGRTVLARARWRVTEEEVRSLDGSQRAGRFEAVQRWRKRRGLPRLVVLAEEDAHLLVDLDNVLGVETLLDTARKLSEVTLTELLPGPDELCVRSPEGLLVHQICVPFRRAGEPAARELPAAQPPPPRFERRFPPGSEWLYAKLYTGRLTAERILREQIGPLVRGALSSGAAESWFFVRYADPDFHLRVRLHGDPRRLTGEVFPALHGGLAPLLGDGRLWKLQLETYEREVERYGGPRGVELAERLFHVDSETVLELLEALAAADDSGAEWRLAVRSVDALLGDLGFDLPGRRALVRQARGILAKELREDKKLHVELGAKYRGERRELERLLAAPAEGDSPLAAALGTLRRRSERLAPLLQELREQERGDLLSRPLSRISSSFVHMHVNRLLRTAPRAQEFVLYDFLDRLYESRAARRAAGGEGE